MMLLKYLWFFVLCALLLIASLAQARDPAQVRAFRKMFPCPSTGKTSGKCEGWVVDHVVPLCWGGTDAPANMQWQELRQSYLKDRFEREACAMKKKYKTSASEFGEHFQGVIDEVRQTEAVPCQLTYSGCEKESEKK